MSNLNDSQVVEDVSTSTETIETKTEASDTTVKVETEKTEEQKAEEAKAEEKKTARKNRFQERTNTLTRQRYEALQEVENWKAMTEVVTGVPAPVRSDYATPEEYQEAIADYRAKVTTPKTMLESAENKVQNLEVEYEQELATNWDEKIAASGIENFAETVATSNLPLTRNLKLAILASEVGPHLVMHFIENPIEARAIMKMPAFEQGRVLRNLEEKIETQLKVKTVTKTNNPNPPPATRVNGGGSTVTKDPGKMSLEEYEKWRKGK